MPATSFQLQLIEFVYILRLDTHLYAQTVFFNLANMFTHAFVDLVKDNIKIRIQDD